MAPKRPRRISVRLPHDVRARLDALAELLKRPGADATRSEAIRAALLAGLVELERSSSGRARYS